MLNREFPQLEIEEVSPMMPLRYLLSGGVSMRNLVPPSHTRPGRGWKRPCHPGTID